MKIKTKTKAGGRCGGGPAPDVQSVRTHFVSLHPRAVRGALHQELPMKIKTKTKAGGRCTVSLPDVQSVRAALRLSHSRAVRSALSTRSFP